MRRMNRNWATLLILPLLISLAPGCAQIEGNPGQAAALMGMAGAATGALIGSQVTDDRTKGALIGGAVGGVVAASATYIWARSMAANKESKTVLNAEETAHEWQLQNPEQPVPVSAQLDIIEDRFDPPNLRCRPGDTVQSDITYRVLGRTDAMHNLVRQDELQIEERAAGKLEYKTVKNFELDENLPPTGTNESRTRFALPPSAPQGNYRLVSTISDPYDFSLSRTVQYTFSIQ